MPDKWRPIGESSAFVASWALIVGLLWWLNDQYVAIALTSVVAWVSLAFVVFDRYIYHSGPDQQNDENGARAYYPNVQTWSYGLLMGAGLVTLYLIARVVINGIEKNEGLLAATDTQSTDMVGVILWRESILLLFLSIALATVVYGLVDISRSSEY